MRLNCLRVTVLMTAVAATACSGRDVPPPEASTGVTLALVDSVRVVESESLYVGRPNEIAVAGDGSVLVSDGAEKRIVRVSRDGSSMTLVARRGGGPTETVSPTAVETIGDSLLAVLDRGRKAVLLFDLASGAPRASFPLRGPGASFATVGERILVGAVWPDSATAFDAIPIDGSAVTRGGSFPAIYRQHPMLADAFGNLQLGEESGDVIGAFEASNMLYRWPAAGGAPDSVELTVSRRRGAKPAVMEEIMRDPANGASKVFTWSFPFVVGSLSANRSAVVMFDPTMNKDGFTGPMFLQVADWRSRRSCPEIALPVPADGAPRFAFRGDTLVGVVQHPEPTDGASTWIVRWALLPGRC